ncbi:MAG: hypothetical protein JEY94_15830 [Melioribacteraceae bacterium]|nr:hypothetical protein [Melioribacteraceae bacterium]
MSINKSSIFHLKSSLGNFDYSTKAFPTYEFHIAKNVREKYSIDETLFSINGNVIFANFTEIRKFTGKINEKRANDQKVKSGLINATGLLDEIFHFLLREYEISENPGVFSRAVLHLEQNIGNTELKWLLTEFVELFPPIAVYKGKLNTSEYLNSSTENRSNYEITLEELLLLHIANFNPANKDIIELFDEKYFSNKETYKKIISALDSFFQKEKTFGPFKHDIFSLLKAPILNSPDDIEGQLEFIKNNFGILIEDKFLNKILRSKDLIREDILLGGFGGGGAPTVVPSFKGLTDNADIFSIGKSGYKYAVDAHLEYDEPENFTEDIGWMPQVVLLAKNAYVWLDQLSKKYQRHIHRLDQVPNEELDMLAGWNFNSLWLIGIWERCEASKKIKHKMGNPDAVASAYSLDDYVIANALGGDEAYDNLNKRAKERGIRLASDMVPNHTGISSKWVAEHPDYFIQTDFPPFPGYKFTGEDLSDHPDIQVRIEDGYYNHSDASVVFQRVDNRNGEVVYIYHGNDGTVMPWNDTAQLNMLKAEVREAVIQKIFHVARKFSIIRFDAAMTLAKKHFQRLWFPQPGTGGDIPSRSDHGLTRQEFDNWFPKEFWREVVDRINSEMPETLLLAEAFWLMEGYFVRTLGMHRVYNSAFMHMLMKEENKKFRGLITNTLEFEPEILKRYVNFMSNPDEETAIKQFGTDDKYFGVCTLMITLPGLPMFAHGQIEGYTEKYGMEYQRAYYNETPVNWLIERHEREIFPLMKKRYLFSQVQNFWYFDFNDDHGSKNSNVFAYTNMTGHERALVFYNNKYDSTSGKIYSSTPKIDGDGNKTKTLANALNISLDDKAYYVFREHSSGLEFIKHGKSFATDGFHVQLQGFEYLVFLDFKEVYDNTGELGKLANELGNRGIPSVEHALRDRALAPIHEAVENFLSEEDLNLFINKFILDSDNDLDSKFLIDRYYYLLNSIKSYYHLEANVDDVIKEFEPSIECVKTLSEILKNELDYNKELKSISIHNSITISEKSNYRENSLIYLLLLSIVKMEGLFTNSEEINVNNFMDKMALGVPLKYILYRLGKGENDFFKEMRLLKTLIYHSDKFFDVFDYYENNKSGKLSVKAYITGSKKKNFIDLFDIDYISEFLGVNSHENISFYSKESFEELTNWFMTISVLNILKKYYIVEPDLEKSELLELIKFIHEINLFIKETSAHSGYKLEEFKKLIGKI